MQPQLPHRKRVQHFDLPGHVHELTFSCYQRRPLLTSDVWRALFCRCLDHALEQHGYQLFAFVLMPEHVHLLVWPKQSGSTIAELLKAIKRPFSSQVKAILQQHQSPLLASLTIRQRPGVTTFRYWQEGPGYDRNFVEPSAIMAAIEYIHLNPVRRKLCETAVDWPWSSANWYLNGSINPTLPRLSPVPADWLLDAD